MKRREYIKMLKSNKKKATRRDELREYKTVELPYGKDKGCKIEGICNIATRKRIITKIEYFI